MTLLLLWGCLDASTPPTREQPAADIDGDGWPDTDDCNAFDAEVHPEAHERCNGLDDNCDGEVDEGLYRSLYLDTDGDGFGVTDQTIQACAAPSGFADLPGDCDDDDPAIHPDADEVCGLKDDDCDGLVDEDDPSLSADSAGWYVDADEDGYGSDELAYLGCEPPDDPLLVHNRDDCDDNDALANPAMAEICDDLDRDDDCDGAADQYDPEGAEDAFVAYADADNDGFGASETMWACELDAGATTTPWDCDDSDPTLNPGQIDICANGIDEDCDGVTDNCGRVTVGESDLDTTIGAFSADLHINGTADINADGTDDVITYHGLNEDVWFETYIFEGPLADGEYWAETDAAGWFPGLYRDELTGPVLSRPGDIDGDGHFDLLITATNQTDEISEAHLVPGPLRGVLSSELLMSHTWPISTVTSFRGIPGEVDANDDGQPDLWISGQTDVLGSFEGTGTARLYLGPVASALAWDEADAEVWTDSCFVGEVIDNLGDVTGDGADDLMIHTACEIYAGGPRSYRIDLVHADADGALDDVGIATLMVETESSYGGLQLSTAGDQDNDGVPDYAFAYFYATERGLRVISGAERGAVDPQADASASIDGLGDSVHFASDKDIDRDTIPDFLVMDGIADEGWVFTSPLAGTQTAADARIHLRDFATYRAYLLGDQDGDGRAELAFAWIGSPDGVGIISGDRVVQ